MHTDGHGKESAAGWQVDPAFPRIPAAARPRRASVARRCFHFTRTAMVRAEAVGGELYQRRMKAFEAEAKVRVAGHTVRVHIH